MLPRLPRPDFRLSPGPPSTWRGWGVGAGWLLCGVAALAQMTVPVPVSVPVPVPLTPVRSLPAKLTGARLSGDLTLASQRAWQAPGRPEFSVIHGTKLSGDWHPASATLGLERGGLGMQLESGYRLSLKVRRGGPSLYLRSQF